MNTPASWRPWLRRRVQQASALLPPALALATTLGPLAALANTVNGEVTFTPYRGELGQARELPTLPGRIEVELNGVPLLDDPLEAKKALVMGLSGAPPELSPAFWLQLRGLQPVLRRGPNLLQLRFSPIDGQVRYRSQFRWAVVSDQTTTATTPQGSTLSTNLDAEGGEVRDSQGPVSFTYRFEAPYARAESWHDDPPIRSLEPADRASILALLDRRVALLSPNFSAAYQRFAAQPSDRGFAFHVDAMRKNRCLERGYAAGALVAAPPPADVRLITTDSPVVVVRSVGPSLFRPANLPGAQARLAALPQDVGFCFELASRFLFPPRLLLVKGRDGQWKTLD
jgi:hypothetical protein